MQKTEFAFLAFVAFVALIQGERRLERYFLGKWDVGKGSKGGYFGFIDSFFGKKVHRVEKNNV